MKTALAAPEPPRRPCAHTSVSLNATRVVWALPAVLTVDAATATVQFFTTLRGGPK